VVRKTLQKDSITRDKSPEEWAKRYNQSIHPAAYHAAHVTRQFV
jgi:hypothetical protein